MAKELRRISAEEFARRLREETNEAHTRDYRRFAFFLGAGCSVSSGIGDAGGLVKDNWLPRLRDLLAPHRKDLDTWAGEEIRGYRAEQPAASYGQIMERLFLHSEERQRELESLCEGRFPGFGYAILANLMALGGGRFNVALTTNFDDLIPDALYLFTQARPLVIQHESLSQFIRPTRTRPLVVKLHGDHRLAPLNTSEETGRLKGDIDKQVAAVLNDRGLIFIGYGGNDQGIQRMLEGLGEQALPFGVFWVSAKEPQGDIQPWLQHRNAIWVEKRDFDELMLLIRDIFELPHPDPRRFEDVFKRYTNTYKVLSERITALPDTAPDAAALKEAVTRADDEFPNPLKALLEATHLWKTDPERADHIYRTAIERDWPFMSARLRHRYAIFLTTVRKDDERAEQCYRQALDAEPNNEEMRGEYAHFLATVRKDYDRAEVYFRRALDTLQAEPYYQVADELKNIRAKFAGFLLARGRREEGLEVLEKDLPRIGLSEWYAESWFYIFAHGPEDKRAEALQHMKFYLEEGRRSPGSILEPNIARARVDKHADVSWMEKLAAVIANEADISILDEWPAWKLAPGLPLTHDLKRGGGRRRA